VVVHPNNPTGHATSAAERGRLEEICAQHGLALIVDEVFLDYPIEEESALRSFAVGPHPVLTFCLSGMSKIAGLPQMKAGWIVGLGPEGVRREAMGRLEVIADTFLSMNAPVQLALPTWLKERGEIQCQILERVRANYSAAVGSGVEVLRVEAGWSAVLRLPQIGFDGEVADRLLQERDVVVHPGSFYGIAEGRRAVVSLIGRTDEFIAGLKRVVEACGVNHGS
jgi:aspartate/methionine/tyrosine aminotransferase